PYTPLFRSRVEAVPHRRAGVQVGVDLGGELGDGLLGGLGGVEHVVVGQQQVGGDQEPGAAGEFPPVVDVDQAGHGRGGARAPVQEADRLRLVGGADDALVDAVPPHGVGLGG